MALNDTPMAPATGTFEDPPFSRAVSEVVAAIRHNLGLVALVVALALALGASTILAFPRTYTATGQITIDPRGLQVVQNDLTPRGTTSEAQAVLVDTETRVLVSDIVLSTVVASERLSDDPEFLGQTKLLNQIRAALFGPKVQSAEQRRLAALEELNRRTRILRPSGTFAVQISVTTSDPRKSAQLVNAIVSSYIEAKGEQRKDAARRAADGLDARLGDLRDRVADAEGKVEAFKRKNNIVTQDGRLNNDQQLSEATSQLVAARYILNERQARYAQVEKALRIGAATDDLPDALKSAAITQLRLQYADSLRQMNSIRNTLGDRHPEVGNQRAQLQAIRSQINAELQRIASSLSKEVDQGKENERRLQRGVDRIVQDNARIGDSLVRLRELERAAQTQRSIYEAFLTRSRELVAQEDIDTSNITVISPATIPLEPSGASPLVIMAVAGALGLSVAAALAVLRARMRGCIRTPNDLAERIGLRVLTCLPVFRLHRRNRGASMVELYDSRSTPGREAILGLGALLDVVPGLGERTKPSVVAVMSAEADAGCSTVALNLSLAFAHDGWRTLLIDANHRDARLTGILSPGETSGLDKVVTRRIPLERAAREVQGYPIAFLGVSPSWDGALQFEPRALAHTLVDPAVDRYDVLVVDCGEASGHPGLRGLAGIADGILLTVRSGATHVRSLQTLHGLLGPAVEKVLGAVLLIGERAAGTPLVPGRPLPLQNAGQATRWPRWRTARAEWQRALSPSSAGASGGPLKSAHDQG